MSFLRGVTDRGAVDMRPTYVAKKYVGTGCGDGDKPRGLQQFAASSMPKIRPLWSFG